MKKEESPARISEHTAMDVLDRVLREGVDEEEVDRILVIVQAKDGTRASCYSNARSEAEMIGMAWRMLHNMADISEDDG